MTTSAAQHVHEIANAYRAGDDVREIAKRYETDRYDIYQLMSRHGIKRPPKIHRSNNEILDAYRNGADVRELAVKCGTTIDSLRSMLSYWGVKRPPGMDRRKGSHRLGSRHPERDAAIVAARRAQRTLESIGIEFGITRERARQVLERAGLAGREFNQTAKGPRVAWVAWQCKQCGATDRKPPAEAARIQYCSRRCLDNARHKFTRETIDAAYQARAGGAPWKNVAKILGYAGMKQPGTNACQAMVRYCHYFGLDYSKLLLGGSREKRA